jgi:hypothetical protein
MKSTTAGNCHKSAKWLLVALLVAAAIASHAAAPCRGDTVAVSIRRGKTVETRAVKAAARDDGMSLVIPRAELEGN